MQEFEKAGDKNARFVEKFWKMHETKCIFLENAEKLHKISARSCLWNVEISEWRKVELRER